MVEKYGGGEKVAQIITFGKLKTRAVIRDVGRVLKIPYGDVDQIAKLIPAMDRLLTISGPASRVSAPASSRVFNSLPAMPVTTQLEDVEKFYSRSVAEAVA